ncbi:hypothetical protein AB0D42_27290 [Streptomyces sp. NPDC048304]|uniref:hypothetical protein n=1 Tax=Streptomyces sp. NPDC048304 TaxID=3154820 RepID=UPI00340AB176
MPPHIAQVIAGHANITTTMGYHAGYPAETIEAHRAFITRHRSLRPAEEYRTPYRRGVGGLPWSLRAPQTLRRHLRPCLRHRLHPRTRLRPVLPSAARPGPAQPTRGDPRQPPGPNRRGRARRLARRERGPPRQPGRGRIQDRAD